MNNKEKISVTTYEVPIWLVFGIGMLKLIGFMIATIFINPILVILDLIFIRNRMEKGEIILAIVLIPFTIGSLTITILLEAKVIMDISIGMLWLILIPLIILSISYNYGVFKTGNSPIRNRGDSRTYVEKYNPVRQANNQDY